MPYTEAQIRNRALVALAAAPKGRLTTTALIDELTDEMKPTGRDLMLGENRQDTLFSQKVRNLVSHRNQGSGLEARGLATYLPQYEGWEITPAGVTLANSINP